MRSFYLYDKIIQFHARDEKKLEQSGGRYEMKQNKTFFRIS